MNSPSDDSRNNAPPPVTREEYEQLLFDQQLLETDVARLAESVQELSRMFARHIEVKPSRSVYDLSRAGQKAESVLIRIKARWRARNNSAAKGGSDAT